jgi:glutathione S-transferase
MSFMAVLGFLRSVMKVIYSIPIPGLPRFIDVASTWTGSVIRLGCGMILAPGVNDSNRPVKPLKLYQYEACPFCKKVRENLSVLDLDCVVYPCPRETMASYGYMKDSRYRPAAKTVGGKAQFPLLVDENTNTVMYESDQIVKYLWKTYGNRASRAIPDKFYYEIVPGFLNQLSLFLSSFMRILPEFGAMRIPSKTPDKPLELWSFEASPYCRIARERLDSLELPYVLHNMPKRSSKRKQFRIDNGKCLFPFLADPNTGFKSFESGDIVKYLNKTYKLEETNKKEE